jgi:UPF0755 protein
LKNSLFKLVKNNYVFIAIVLVVTISSVRFLTLSIPVYINQENAKFTIPKGANLSRIADLLYKKGIINNPESFILAARFMFKSESLKAGYFNLQSAKTHRSLIRILSNSRAHAIRITVPEGYQSRQIARLLADQLNFTSTEFMQYSHDSTFLETLGIHSGSLEGYLFPDTYDFNDSDDPTGVIRKMVGRFHEMVNDSIRQAIIASNRTLHEVLTLASIVEGECMVDDERPIVASVYINRLRKRMRLESDPTIQYIISDGPRRLLSKDLEIESPYNTYKNRGLPPGPINNPGIKSIIAATWPAKTDYLYMVAVGDGTHNFTRDYDSFLKAKRRFQRVRRQVARGAKRKNTN